MSLAYLAALLVAIAGMVVLDLRFLLFFRRDPRRAAVVLVVGVAFFLLWDTAGIRLGVFFRGETSFMTGVQLAPELPLEELFFLVLLCYLTMNLVGAVTRVLGSRSGLRKAFSRSVRVPGSRGRRVAENASARTASPESSLSEPDAERPGTP